MMGSLVCQIILIEKEMFNGRDVVSLFLFVWPQQGGLVGLVDYPDEDSDEDEDTDDHPPLKRVRLI